MARVTHFEIHADKPERACDFYKKVFGWEIFKWEGPVDYWLVSTGPEDKPGINGAIMERNTVVTNKGIRAFVCTIDIEDLDKTIGQVTSNGGQIEMPRMAVPGIGYMAYCSDTEGNIFGIMQEDATAA